jgi:hypothetical protein
VLRGILIIALRPRERSQHLLKQLDQKIAPTGQFRLMALANKALLL